MTDGRQSGPSDANEMFKRALLRCAVPCIVLMRTCKLKGPLSSLATSSSKIILGGLGHYNGETRETTRGRVGKPRASPPGQQRGKKLFQKP
eukprot:g29232.t1